MVPIPAARLKSDEVDTQTQVDAANNPPAVNTPSIFYGTMDTLFQGGAAFTLRPSNVFGLERDAKTPRSYNYSAGIQRELGWGTVVDITYSGSVSRNLEVVRNINVVPDGARFLDINPQNRDPFNATAAQIQSAVQALSNVGSGNAAATGGPVTGVQKAFEMITKGDDVLDAVRPSLKAQMRLWWDLVQPDGYGYAWGRSLGVVSYLDTLEIVAFLARNCDLGDAWEWINDPSYPVKYGLPAYKVGINVVIYAMSH